MTKSSQVCKATKNEASLDICKNLVLLISVYRRESIASLCGKNIVHWRFISYNRFFGCLGGKIASFHQRARDWYGEQSL